MNQTDRFNEQIRSSYKDIRIKQKTKELPLAVRPVPQITVKQGDFSFANRIGIRLEENPKVMVTLLNSMSYQEEMNQRRLTKRLNQTDLVFQKLEQRGDEAEIARELSRRDAGQQKVNNLKKELLKESTKEVQVLVQQNMKEQLSVLADKVYKKMEKSLRDEKKRKGW